MFVALQMTGLDDRDIVFVRYVGQAKDRNCLPYFIAVDESTKSVGVYTSSFLPHQALLAVMPLTVLKIPFTILTAYQQPFK